MYTHNTGIFFPLLNIDQTRHDWFHQKDEIQLVT